jgi:hypothetical protein
LLASRRGRVVIARNPASRSRSGAADRARIFRFWTKIGAVVALLIFLIGHNFPIAY